jgi:glutamyl-tRNA reductase
MEIISVGLNHKTAPLQLRERLAFPESRLPLAYLGLSGFSSIYEAMILSTCNRVEIYAVTEDACGGFQDLKEFLSVYHRINAEEFQDYLYVYSQPDSIRHLFNIACGLDSMVIGETQILGQVKGAYFQARQNNCLGPFLEPLLQRTFHVAKKVRSSTNITRGAVSVSSVAVRLAEEILGSLSRRKVMIIGAGEVSELVARCLVSKGTSSILVSSRTFHRATELASRFSGKAIRFDDLFAFLTDADIVISSTAAPHLLLKKQDLLALVKQRKKPLFLIDLAVPRDIDPAVRDLRGIFLYDIDDLKRIANENLQLRQDEIEACDRIIHSQTRDFMDWLIKRQTQMIEAGKLSGRVC